MITRYFATEQAAIDALQAKAEAMGQELEALVEEHGGEDGLLEGAKTEKGKLTKASIKARLGELKGLADVDDERTLLLRYQELLEDQAAAESELKEQKQELEGRVYVRYSKLSEDEIKTMVVQMKWLGAIGQGVQDEFDRVTRRLAERVRTLEERYARPLPALVDEVEALSARVDAHLRAMGLSWGAH